MGAVGLAALGPWVGVAAALVCLASGVIYSVGPRLKTVPILGTFLNATNFVPLLWAGAITADPPMARHLAPAFAGILLQSQIFHEAADAEGDARAGVRTTFLAIGRGGSALLSALFGALPVLGPGPIAVRFGLVVVFVLLFPLAFAGVARDPARAARLRAWHRICGLVIGAGLFLREMCA
jgi:4-hydroxybenzoate polyprenyltransferase